MKLKKIASLALAGVMAVSMLAGCKNGAASSSSSSSSESTTASSVADMMYSELTGSAKTNVNPVASADLDKALEDAVAKYYSYACGADIVTHYDELVGLKTAGKGNQQIADAVYDAMKADFAIGDLTDEDREQDKSKKVAVTVYAVPGSTSDAYAMKLVANHLDTTLSMVPTEGNSEAADSKPNYDYSYDLSASITTRTVNYNGVDMGIKYVAVMVVKTATEKN